MDIPELIQQRLARAAATFRIKYPDVDHDDVVELMVDTITIVDDFLHGGEREESMR